MKKKGGKAKIVYVGRGVVFVRQDDGRLVRVRAGRMTVAERVYTSRVVGRD